MADARPATLTDLLDATAARQGEGLAVAGRNGLRTERLSYQDLAKAAEAVARQLAAQPGLVRGDRILLWAPNSPRLVAVLFGLLRAGFVAVPMDQNSTPEFLRAVADKTGAAALIMGGREVRPDGMRVFDLATFDLSGEGRAPARGSGRDRLYLGHDGRPERRDAHPCQYRP